MLLKRLPSTGHIPSLSLNKDSQIQNKRNTHFPKQGMSFTCLRELCIMYLHRKKIVAYILQFRYVLSSGCHKFAWCMQFELLTGFQDLLQFSSVAAQCRDVASVYVPE